ncbi:MAG: hypothetical protein HQK98_09880 [Nitrospirae bacterium]|nr:hypothetical protein [Nitrospirota bacterium]
MSNCVNYEAGRPCNALWCADFNDNYCNRDNPKWQYGIPKEDGWYWMLGYDGLPDENCKAFYVVPVMVEIKRGAISVYENSYYYHGNLCAIFLPITPPVVEL